MGELRGNLIWRGGSGEDLDRSPSSFVEFSGDAPIVLSDRSGPLSIPGKLPKGSSQKPKSSFFFSFWIPESQKNAYLWGMLLGGPARNNECVQP